MKQKYVMPEMVEMKEAFDEFYSKAQEFIKKYKEMNNVRDERLSTATKSKN